MWIDNFLMVAQWRFPSFGAKLLSILVWSTAVLEHRPSQEWLLCFEQQVHAGCCCCWLVGACMHLHLFLPDWTCSPPGGPP